MAVSIRMKRFGRHRRPFFRVCAIDSKRGRDGRVIEELGYYDPLVRDVDARAVLKGERIAYWVSVGAQPSEAVAAKRVALALRPHGPARWHEATFFVAQPQLHQGPMNRYHRTVHPQSTTQFAERGVGMLADQFGQSR